MNREKILRKLKNLIEKTQHNGCSESEALTAAMKVGELMERYNVSMDEVQFANEKFRKIQFKLLSRKTNYMRGVIRAIAYFTDTKYWMGWYRPESSYKNYRCYNFFGSDNDVMIAEYLYSVIDNSIQIEFRKFKESQEYKNSKHHGKVKNVSFFDGITNRISRRLEDMKDKMMERRFGSEENGIELSNESSLIVYDKFEIVEKKFKTEFNIELKKAYSKRTKRDSNAYNNGVLSGDKINIRKAVTGVKMNQQKLIE